MAFKEAPEGIVFGSAGNLTGIDFTDILGLKHTNTEIIGLSKSQIETVDLISEGQIQGPVSGIWTFSGGIGEVGYRSAYFSGYNVPTGLIGGIPFTGKPFLRSIYWNEVPVLGDEGKFNFQSIGGSSDPGDNGINFTLGTPNGQQLQQLSPFQKTSRTINERLRKTVPKTYRIFNKDCRGVVVNVKIPQLSKTDPTTGDVQRTSVEFNISYRPFFANRIAPPYTIPPNGNQSVFGKIVAANGYVNSIRIDFTSDVWGDPDFQGWEVRIERTTDESVTSLLNNLTYVESITEIQGNVYTYPNSAMVRSLFNAEFFQSVPERAFDMELLKVPIPGNYNPILRTYATGGFATTNYGWDGNFATGKQYTNNPAWCYYDLLTNRRYGLGKYIDSSFVDKWTLYNIAQYCDTLVSDGQGGLEPRFQSNVWFTTREDAYKVINDFASIFRGLVYYANNLIYTVQDSPVDPILGFTNANVENGDFNYASTSKRNRHSIAIVRYNDPLNFYRPAVEYVEDFDAIRKYGVREIELTAFGCTSRGQAIRLGRWALLSDNLDAETCSFVAGLDAAYLRPGDVFKVFDANKKTKRHGGRIKSITNIGTPATGSSVVLDGNIGPNLENTVGYSLSVVTPSYNFDVTQVSGINSTDTLNIRRNFIQKFDFSGFQASGSGNQTVINLGYAFDVTGYSISGNPIWSLELTNRFHSGGYTGERYFTNPNFDYYRALNIKESEPHKFEIIGLQYNANKYVEIESGIVLQSDLIGQNKIPATPYNLTFDVYKRTDNSKVITYSFLIDDLTNVNSFRVYSKNGPYPSNDVPDNAYLRDILPPEITADSFIPFESGIYNFRVYSSNDRDGFLSPGFATGTVEISDIVPIRDIIVSTLQCESWTGTYSGNAVNKQINLILDNDANPVFTWQNGFINDNSILADLQHRITIRDIDLNGSRIPTDNVYYEESGVLGNTWTFTLDKNINIPAGPLRQYQIVVEAHDSAGRTSAGNLIGSLPDVGWPANSFGYDLLDFNNPRPSGIELSDNIRTANEAGMEDQLLGLSDGNILKVQSGPDLCLVSGTNQTFSEASEGIFRTYQWLGHNGEISVNFLQGPLEVDIVGGYMYTFTGVDYNKNDITISSTEQGAQTTKTEFTFNPLVPQIFAPTAAYRFKGLPDIFASVSFFDSLDKAIINKGTDISSDLYVSNTVLIENHPNLGCAAISNSSGSVSINSVTTTGYIPNVGYDNQRVMSLIGGSVSNDTVVVLSITSTSTMNVETTFSTIFYAGCSSHFTPGIHTYPPSGFLATARVVMSDGTTKAINNIVVGDKVESRTIANFNSMNDNWNSFSYLMGTPKTFQENTFIPFSSPQIPTVRVVTGTVTSVSSNVVASYYRINSDLEVTPEEPILFYRAVNSTVGYTKIRPASELILGDILWLHAPTGKNGTHGINRRRKDLIPVPIISITNVVAPAAVYNIQTDSRLFIISGVGLNSGNFVVHDGVTLTS